jgi:glucokinase
MSDAGMYAGIDLGGTKILVVIADESGHVVASRRIPTEAERGPDAVIDRMVDAVRAAAEDARVPVERLAAVGVSAPGPIDLDDGIITSPPNLPGWRNVRLAAILGERLGRPVVLENDANCAAVGEHRFGAGRGYRHIIYITISTGIGGGIIIDGELYRGASGAAGEVGHMGVSVDGPACAAGHPGCLEGVAAGSGIAARAAEMIEAGGLPLTARLAAEEPPLSVEEIYRAGQEGEAEAAALIDRAAYHFGMCLATLINVFNPQAVVIGGGLMNLGDALLRPALRVAETRAFAQPFADVRIVPSELGDRAAALGAIAVARRRDVGEPV